MWNSKKSLPGVTSAISVIIQNPNVSLWWKMWVNDQSDTYNSVTLILWRSCRKFTLATMQISEEVNNTFWINNNISTPNNKCDSRWLHEFVYDYIDFYDVFTTPSQIYSSVAFSLKLLSRYTRILFHRNKKIDLYHRSDVPLQKESNIH